MAAERKKPYPSQGRGEATVINISMLNGYVGKHISQICPNGYDANNIWHCAHFVAHALDIMVGTKCTNIVHGPGPGASIRVNEIFNDWCPKVIDELSKSKSWSSRIDIHHQPETCAT
jgi:hypothetical protein